MKKNGKNCIQCGKELTGQQSKFCSNKCKQVDKMKKQRTGVSEPAEQSMQKPAVASLSVAKAAETEDQREALVALRQKLAVEIDLSESARDLGTLSARFLETLERIQSIDDKRNETKGGGALDEFTKRREARRAPAA